MGEKILFQRLIIEEVYTEREVNFIVMDEGTYLFRLVPTLSGFEISKLDQSLKLDIDTRLMTEACNKIENYFA